MASNLFVKWDDSGLVNHAIIDEQHRGLIAIINSIYFFIQEGWPISDLKPTILMLEQYVMFHLKTEQSILVSEGLPEEDMKIVQAYDAKFLAELHEQTANAIEEDEPNHLTLYLAKWWLGHKTDFHDQLADYFNNN